MKGRAVGSDVRRLVLTMLGLLALLIAVDRLAAGVVGGGLGSRVVLIGDSVFYSYYIDTPDQALWKRLEVSLGVGVFPAALTGASPQDMLAVARRVARTWPAGSIALVGIHPVHLFGPGITEFPPEARPAPRFAPIDGTSGASAGDALNQVEQRLVEAVEAHSFLARSRESILWYLDAQVMRRTRTIASQRRDRRWNTDNGGALERFRGLTAALAGGGRARMVPYSWVVAIDRVQRASGIRPVFVLTPLNFTLVRQHADPEVPVERMLVSSHDYLVQQLAASGVDYIDLFSGFESDSFADAIHTNARGNDQLAGAIARWLAHGHDGRVED
jgi:hypothetical protein